MTGPPRAGRLRDGWASIRVRVTTVAAVTILLVTTVGSAFFVLSLHQSLERGLVSDVRQQLRTIQAQLADGATPRQVVITGRGDVVVQLVDAGGHVVASDHRALQARPLLSRAGRDEDAVVPGEGSERYTVVARTVQPVAGTPGSAVTLLIVGRSSLQARRARDATTTLLVLAVPVVTALLALTVWLSVGRALRPVESMRREADAITSAHLGRRLAEPAGRDEIPRLATTLNEMLDRIDLGQRLQRQFVSDASHELRSPLTVIRQAAEVARSYPDRVAVGDLAGDVLAESRRLGGLVDALLLLARLDDGAPVAAGAVDLDDLVLAEAERARASTDLVQVDVSHVSGGQVHGNPTLLAQVVRNLVANALRHATARVSVTLREWNGHVELYVDDDGCGVAPADRERVFERFVRLDEGRARDEGGSGLGLAIVRTIVETSGGTVTLGSSPAGGARFLVVLPAVD